MQTFIKQTSRQSPWQGLPEDSAHVLLVEGHTIYHGLLDRLENIVARAATPALQVDTIQDADAMVVGESEHYLVHIESHEGDHGSHRH